MMPGLVIAFVKVLVERRMWVLVCYVDLEMRLRSARGLVRAMLRESCGRLGRQLLGRPSKTLWLLVV
jgi:hypothetical protein